MPWRTLFKWSKNIHKYTGLVFLLYFLSAGVSGVLLNHPSLIRKVATPLFFTPPAFRFENWNRMAMREAVFSVTDSESLIVGGRAGVWGSPDGGRTFFPMDEGYPASAFERDTLCLLLYESDGERTLYAGTRNGLYRFEFERNKWQGIEDVRLENTEVVDLVRRKESVLVFTPAACYRLEGGKQSPVLRLMPMVSGAARNRHEPFPLAFHVRPPQRPPLPGLARGLHLAFRPPGRLALADKPFIRDLRLALSERCFQEWTITAVTVRLGSIGHPLLVAWDRR